MQPTQGSPVSYLANSALQVGVDTCGLLVWGSVVVEPWGGSGVVEMAPCLDMATIASVLLIGSSPVSGFVLGVLVYIIQPSSAVFEPTTAAGPPTNKEGEGGPSSPCAWLPSQDVAISHGLS